MSFFFFRLLKQLTLLSVYCGFVHLPQAKQKNRGVNEIWTDAVQLAASNASKGVAPKALSAHLVRMGDLGNVPRQEKKFKARNQVRISQTGVDSRWVRLFSGVCWVETARCQDGLRATVVRCAISRHSQVVAHMQGTDQTTRSVVGGIGEDSPNPKRGCARRHEFNTRRSEC